MIMAQKRVLVIEDNPLNMKLFKAILHKEHYSVLEAVDAETGIVIATEQPPDLILMDIQLPGMDGLKATKVIKSNPELRDIPVVAITGFAMHTDRTRAEEAGCAGYMTKPIRVHEFIQTVARYLE